MNGQPCLRGRTTQWNRVAEQAAASLAGIARAVVAHGDSGVAADIWLNLLAGLGARCPGCDFLQCKSPRIASTSTSMHKKRLNKND
jgi:hypothetical protein